MSWGPPPADREYRTKISNLLYQREFELINKVQRTPREDEELDMINEIKNCISLYIHGLPQNKKVE